MLNESETVRTITRNAVAECRQAFYCPIFGEPRNFQPNKLPTYECVLRCCFEERYKLSLLKNNRNVCFSDVASTVAKQIKFLYNKASIPALSDCRIVKLIDVYHDSYVNIKKSYKRDKDKPAFKSRLEDFKHKAKSLFDVAACKCPIIVNCICKKKSDACQCDIFIQCLCEKSKKISVLDLRFMYLQRNYNLGKIGSIDKVYTKKLNAKAKRNARDIQRVLEGKEVPKIEEYIEIDKQSVFEESECYEDEYKPSSSTKKPRWQMRIKLSTTALNSDRFGVSDRATAAIASSVLQDIGMITNGDSSYVIDKCKIRREKAYVRTDLKNEFSTPEESWGLFFDGRKDDTLFVERLNGKQFRRNVKEEHYSLIQEPGSIYIGHVSPSSSSATDITQNIISRLSALSISLEKLELVGCDGTVTNTGWKNGVVHQLENHVGRPLQWSICLLHFNELPFRHIFQHIDGQTAGPKSFTGPIGHQLTGCEKLPVVCYEPIDCSIPDIDRNLLSKDQQYLLDISGAITLGHCPEDLANRDPGPLSHSRWLTAANRILRLYISSSDPSGNLKEIVGFILKSYMPMWFSIKKSKYFIDGPRHVFQVIQTSRYLPGELLQVVDPVIERNAFFAHPENILLAMIVDEREHIRELGYRRILKARQTVLKKKTVRNFIPPNLNFQASDYTEIINWNSCALYPPPILRGLNEDDIKSLINSNNKSIREMQKFPCHTQAVERCVKLVTEASNKVCGHEARDGYIRATLKSRSLMPHFSQKSDFKFVEGIKKEK